MPSRKPFKPMRQRTGTTRLTAAAIIGFSFTFVAAGIAMLMGFVPERTMLGLTSVDATVVLLFVPLCALTFGILAEAVRTTLTGNIHRAVRVQANPLEPWRPGHGEG